MEYLQYWKYGAVGVIALFMVGKFAWSKFNVSKVFTKKVEAPKVVDLESLEIEDQKAMAHLRNRAITFANDDLIKDLKSVHTKFYDIHCQAVKGSK